MKAFAELYRSLDDAKGTSHKLSALVEYFRKAPPGEAAWALHMLMGNRPRRIVSAPRLREWAADAARLPGWLLDECHDQVGDLAETIALVTVDVAGEVHADTDLQQWIEERLLPLRGADAAVQRLEIQSIWRHLDQHERLVWNKLITGAFRVGVAGKLVIRAVAHVAALPEEVVTHRLMGGWEPSAEAWDALISSDVTDSAPGQPYPFALATALDLPPSELGLIKQWVAEWKWDGIRAQCIRRRGRTWLWSRGEDLLEGRFPELEEGAALFPDGTVLDGEILPWRNRDDRPLPFAQLQRRIGRKSVSHALLSEVPVRFVAYDLLEEAGSDIRGTAFEERRAALEALIGAGRGPFRVSQLVLVDSWQALTEARSRARDHGAEGLMLKERTGSYQLGRRRGGWWKWKVDPLTADAVLTAAQGGSGRRSGLFTDYTFSIWDGDQLVPFAKAYSGLTDEEILRVDQFVRNNTTGRFGPVRTVAAELVFELAFEGIQKSTRHRSGVAVRFPRIARWRHDKKAADADTLDTIRRLLDVIT